MRAGGAEAYMPCWEKGAQSTDQEVLGSAAKAKRKKQGKKLRKPSGSLSTHQ